MGVGDLRPKRTRPRKCQVGSGSSPFVDVGGQITGDTRDSIASTGLQRLSYRSGGAAWVGDGVARM